MKFRLILVILIVSCQTPQPITGEQATGLCSPISEKQRLNILNHAKSKLAAQNIGPTDEAKILIELLTKLNNEPDNNTLKQEGLKRLDRINRTYSQDIRSFEVILAVIAGLDCPRANLGELDKIFSRPPNHRTLIEALYALKGEKPNLGTEMVSTSNLLNEIERMTR